MSFKIQNNIKTGIGDYISTPIWNAGQIQGIDVSDFSGITDGEVMVYDQALNEWVARDLVIPIEPSNVANVLVVASPAETGQYSTITSAMNAITDASALNPYVIQVGPGLYTEENITIKSYVSVVGYDKDVVRVISNTGINSVFNMSDNTNLVNISLESTSLGVIPLLSIGDSNNVYISQLNLRNAPRGISIGPSNTGEKSIVILAVESDAITDYVVSIDGTGTGLIEVILNVVRFALTTAASAIRCFGSNALFNLFSGHMDSVNTGIGVNIYNGATAFISGIYINRFDIGVSDVGGGLGSDIVISSTEFNMVNTYIQVINPLTTGYANGYIGLPNVSINASSSFFLANVTNLIISVEKKGGTFTSIADAITYINGITPAPSFAQQYTIQVGSGSYTEPQIIIPQFVQIVGLDPQETILTPSNNGANFIVANPNTGISNVTINGPTGAFSTIIFSGSNVVTNTLGSLYIINVKMIGSGGQLITVNTDSGAIASVFIRTITIIPGFNTAILLNNTTGALVRVIIDRINFSNNVALGSPISIIRTMGVNTIQLLLNNNSILDPLNTGQVTFTEINTGGTIIVSQLLTSNLRSSLTINNSALVPTINMISSVLLTPNPNALVISNPNATGSINVTASASTMSIIFGSLINIFTQSPITGTISLTGNIRQGATFPEITNISESIQKGSSVGILTGGVISNVGLDISVSSGTGYLVAALGGLQYTTWGILNVTLGANVSKYLYITEAGTLQTADALPDTLTNIIVGLVKTGAADVDFIQEISNQATHTPQLLDDVSRRAFGPIYSSGSIVSDGAAARSFDVTSGTYYYGSHGYNPSGATPITIIGYYGVNSSVAPFTQLSTPFQYDNAGVLTDITLLMFVKHTLYVVNDGADEKYLLVYGQTQYASSLLAQNAALATPPLFISGNVAQIAGIVVEGGAAVIDTILDIRPVVGFRASSVGTTPTDHQSLSNRADPTAHSQYYLKSGDTMTGALNMGTNNITNAGTYNSVTVEAHASRHLPGGADPLTTAAPVSVGTVNTEGVAASFSRSDHIHNHGVQTDPTFHALCSGVANGFMSSGDKTKLDASTSTPTANALVQYNASLGLNSRNVNVLSSGIAPGNQNALVLYDSASGNVSSVSLRSPDSVVSYTLTLPTTSGSSGQLLQNNGSGTLIWVTPSNTRYVIQRRTTTTQNLNQAVASLITWDITDINDVVNYAIVSNTTIRVLSTGRYELYVNMVTLSANNETSLIIKMQINGANTPSSARSFYVRATSSVNNSSGSFRTIVDLNANDVITVTSQQNGANGTVTSISGESMWCIKTI